MTDTTTYFRDSDLLHLKIGEGRRSASRILDSYRIADYDENGDLLAVEFPEASLGIELEDLPQSDNFKALLQVQAPGEHHPRHAQKRKMRNRHPAYPQSVELR